MVLDPITKLASVLDASPGCYALLIGSGVSRSAGIPSGWDVVNELIKRAANAEGESPENPAEWLAAHGEEGDYSRLLEEIAPSTGDRQALLDSFFEPTDEEREQGLKQPTAAHRAIAELTRAGVIKVIVTTNFDRLIERALTDAGVEPIVIASASDAAEMGPLHSLNAVVIKVHGDRRMPNLKNTVDELGSYEEPMERLLRRVFEDYGMIIVGWSGEWDAALRELMMRHSSGVFSTFFTYRHAPAKAAATLIKTRIATPIAIEDADSFFERLHHSVVAIQRLHAPSTAVSSSRVKVLMSDEKHRIELHDTVMDAVAQYQKATALEHLPNNPQEGRSLESEFVRQVGLIEDGASDMIAVIATLAYYADRPEHDDLLVRAMERLASRPTDPAGFTVLSQLKRYPVTLVLYSMGIACIASGRVQPIARVLSTVKGRDQTMGESQAIAAAYWFTPAVVIDESALRAAFEGSRSRKTPVSDHVADVLGDELMPIIGSREEFDGYFDDFEYLMGLSGRHVTARWVPMGRFTWRRMGYTDRGEYDRVVEAHRSALLAAGMFGGDSDTLEATKQDYDGQLSGAS